MSETDRLYWILEYLRAVCYLILNSTVVNPVRVGMASGRFLAVMASKVLVVLAWKVIWRRSVEAWAGYET